MYLSSWHHFVVHFDLTDCGKLSASNLSESRPEESSNDSNRVAALLLWRSQWALFHFSRFDAHLTRINYRGSSCFTKSKECVFISTNGFDVQPPPPDAVLLHSPPGCQPWLPLLVKLFPLTPFLPFSTRVDWLEEIAVEFTPAPRTLSWPSFTQIRRKMPKAGGGSKRWMVGQSVLHHWRFYFLLRRMI